jgi:hypothetical protein
MPETQTAPATVDTPTVQTDLNLTDPPAPAQKASPEEPLIAGKFRTQADLEKAYKELEAKLGTAKAPESDDSDTSKAPAEPSAKKEEPVMVAGLPADKFFKEYADTGKLSEASYKELSDKGIPKSLVDAYIAGQQSISKQTQDFNDQTVKGLIDSVGGQESFTQMSQWAGTAYTDAEKADYQAAVDSGNLAAAKAALLSLKLRYEAAFGTRPGSTIEGTAPTAPAGFRSKAEMVAAMKDPRYQNDPAYRRDVEMKVMGMNM